MQEVPVMEELAEPRPTYICPRRLRCPKTDANRVERDTFARHSRRRSRADAPRNRLGLAQWLTDPNHPLTARVFVNRLWANFFGRGLVATPENFGRQGAARPIPNCSIGWPAISSTTAGTSSGSAGRSCCRPRIGRIRGCGRSCASAIRRTMLLARGPSRRLSAEQIRDVALAASGLLERDTGRAAGFALSAGRRLVARIERDVARLPAIDRQGLLSALALLGVEADCAAAEHAGASTRRRAKCAWSRAAARTRRCRRWCC